MSARVKPGFLTGEWTLGGFCAWAVFDIARRPANTLSQAAAHAAACFALAWIADKYATHARRRSASAPPQ